MNEFEKILGRLDELIEKSYYKATEGSHNAGIRNSAYHKVKKIVQEVAEEFATDTNVGTNGWIPCSGCKDCKNKECEHYGKV